MDRHETEHKSFGEPDETREFPNGRAEILNVGNGEVGRLVFEPGWRWSNDVKPIAQTDSCQVEHLGYVISGRMRVTMDDGSSAELRAGDVCAIPPGHDAEVIGDEACVMLDVGEEESEYAKRH